MSPPSPSETLPSAPLRWEGMAAIVGGVLWIVAYMLSVPLGRENGPARADASASWLDWSYFATFAGATLALGAGLAGLHARLWRRRKASLPGLLLAVLALAAASTNLLLLTGLLGPVRIDYARAGQGVMTTCASATLLGLATRREHLLPRGGSTALLATGVLTVVLIVASMLPLGPVPVYLVGDLPFALAGAAWIALGVAMRTKQ